MRYTLAFGLLTLVAGVTAQSEPACVNSCFKSDPVSSECNGDETGTALAQCTCDSLTGSLLIQCIKRCSASDQAVYASGLPPSCASALFPGQAVSGVTSIGASSSVALTTAPSGGNFPPDTAASTSTTTQSVASTTVPATSSTSNAAIQTMVPNVLAGGIAAALLLL